MDVVDAGHGRDQAVYMANEGSRCVWRRGRWASDVNATKRAQSRDDPGLQFEELWGFRGHLDDWTGGVHDVEQSGAVHAGI